VGRRDLDPSDIVRFEEDGPRVVLLDQRRVPDEVVELECRSVDELVVAIRELAIRGAPAIGVAAEMGIADEVIQRGEYLTFLESVLDGVTKTHEAVSTLYFGT